MMSDANRGWLFYKYPFLEGSGYKSRITKANRYILETKKSSYTYPAGTHKSIELETIYPGLVVGSGYTHSLKNVTENFDFGFFFDHTTGMPVIPGSTVKGILRSLFGQNKGDQHKEEKESLIKDLLNKPNIDVNALFQEIFLGIDTQTGKEKSMYHRDIFYDAYITSGDSEGYIFKDDSITPHSKDGLSEPVPNRMLKVAPGVRWNFSFDLHGDIITAEEKEVLFLQLLQWHGVGAKTNVGYGHFEEMDVNTFQEQQKKQQTNAAINNASGFDKLLLQINKIEKVNNTMAQLIKKYQGSIDDKEKIVNLVKSKMPEETNKSYRRIINRIDELCSPNP